MPRTNFNNSRLIRLLADLSIVESTGSKQAFAERLGQWLDFSDAITLHAAHGAGAVSPAAAPPQVQSVASGALAEELERVRTALVDSIMSSCLAGARETRTALPTPKPGAAIETAVAYEPYRRFHLAHQGAMEAAIRPLRNHVRKALSGASAALRQLATLDAALESILGQRERQLLATVPWLLEKRFEHLLRAHRQRPVDPRQAEDPVEWMQAGAWLERFCRELQGVLLAELDLRLQPTLGLIEALSNRAV